MAGSLIALESCMARGQHWQKQSQPSSAMGAGKTNLMVDAFPSRRSQRACRGGRRLMEIWHSYGPARSRSYWMVDGIRC